MKTPLIITVFFLLLFHQGCRQKKNATQERIFGGSFTCSEPPLWSEIIQNDTSFSNGNSQRTIHSKNQLGKVLRVETTTFNQKAGEKYTEKIEVFDKDDNLVFFSVSQNGFPFHCYNYVYDNKGRLIRRSGYGSGDMGGVTRYIYQGDKLVETIRE